MRITLTLATIATLAACKDTPSVCAIEDSFSCQVYRNAGNGGDNQRSGNSLQVAVTAGGTPVLQNQTVLTGQAPKAAGIDGRIGTEEFTEEKVITGSGAEVPLIGGTLAPTTQTEVNGAKAAEKSEEDADDEPAELVTATPVASEGAPKGIVRDNDSAAETQTKAAEASVVEVKEEERSEPETATPIKSEGAPNGIVRDNG